MPRIVSPAAGRHANFTGLFVALASLILVGCGDSEPPNPERYQASDQLFQQVEANVAANTDWRQIATIDHSRLGTEAGSSMPPAKVIIFSDPELETAMIQAEPMLALDLPLRILAFETEPGGASKVIYNRFDYLESRYRLAENAELEESYEEEMSLALEGITDVDRAEFSTNQMQEDGIVTIASPFDFNETLKRVNAAIESQDDTVTFGSVDFREQAAALGVRLRPSTMILFGAPGPGARVMSAGPTLGLDGFCQKFLVWQDDNGRVFLSFNDLLALAERQDVTKGIALRVVDYRLTSVFEEALED